MKKKYISIIIGFLILSLGVFLFLIFNRDIEDIPLETAVEREINVTVDKVKLHSLPYVIEATGVLKAKDKVEVYSEVQGILKKTKLPFKIGNRFKQGDVLISIDAREHSAQIKSTRSDLMNQIAAMLPDMEIDYPSLSQKWEVYLQNYDVNLTTPELPPFSSTEEKLFVSGKNVLGTYFSIKNLEERLRKYRIIAPFNGIITESTVNYGSLIRSGQKIGELINDSALELTMSISATENQYIKIGDKINLFSIDNSQSYKGKIRRVNGKINQDTQTVEVIVSVLDKNLADGQYLKAIIKGRELLNVLKIDNTLILENTKVYVVSDNKLKLKNISVMNYQGNMAIISGLENGDLLITQNIANAYPGMPINIVQ